MSVGNIGHVVVGGGSGFIGTHLCNILRNNNYGYTVISRMPGPNRMTWHDLQNVGLPEETTAVVNLTGQNVLDMTQRWNEGFKQNVWNSRIKSTCSLAHAISTARCTPNAFITMSGVGIYEPHKTMSYTENHRSVEFDFMSKLCMAWEAAGKLSSEVPCRHIILRSGVVLGKDGGMIKSLYLPFLFGLGGPIMPGTQFLPWIHVGDLCRLIFHCIQHKQVTGILNAVAPETITNKEFSKAFGRALNRPAFIPVPKAIMNMLLSHERAKIVTQGQKVVPCRTKSIGFQYTFPTIQSACDAIAHQPPKTPF